MSSSRLRACSITIPRLINPINLDLMKTTKLIGILLTLALYGNILTAQKDTKKSNTAYIGIGYGYGTEKNILGISGTIISEGKWGVSISIRRNLIQQAENLPPDYLTGNCFLSYFNKGLDCIPNDYASMAPISLIREFSLPNSTGAISVALGAAFNKFRFAEFTPFENPPTFSSNYSFSYTVEKNLGLFLRVKRTFPFTKLLGMEIAGTANLNKIKSYFALELYFLLGDLR